MGRRFYWAGCLVLGALVACKSPAFSPIYQYEGPESGGGGANETVAGSAAGGGTGTSMPVALFASFSPQSLVSPQGSLGGSGGTTPLGAPYGISSQCGDAIVGLDAQGKPEECDDGDEGSDACTASCQTRDEPVVAGDGVDRYQGVGRHPVSGLDQGFISTFVEFPDGEPEVGATLFDIWGRPAHHVSVSEGAFPIEESNPVAAALPNGEYAVAWTDFDGDGSDLGIALRKVRADGTLGIIQVANSHTAFSQRNPDLLWTGNRLIVAWEDYADASNGPDLRYRAFDQDLNPLGDDVDAAVTSAPEAALALASFNGGIVASYRETIVSGADAGKENVVVQAGGKSYRLGPMLGGAAEDRPALAALDATHLLLVFTEGTDPLSSGVANTPRLRYSVIDTASQAAPTYQWLDPLDDVYAADLKVSQMSPALAAGVDGLYLTWRSEARSGDAAGDQLWLKYLKWNPGWENPLALTEKEALLPRVCEASIGDQRTPAIAMVGLPPSGALALAWDDYSHSQGSTSGDPDVVVHYAPIHQHDANAQQVVTESWTGSSGALWPAQWSHLVPSGNTSPPATIQANQGQILYAPGTGSDIAYINNHKALDVEQTTQVRINLNGGYAGFVARYQETNPPSYIFGRISTTLNDTWTISAVINGGTPIVIANGQTLSSTSLPGLFTLWAQMLTFNMKFRVVSNPDGSIWTGLKLWLADLPEPSWTPSAFVMAGTTSNAQILSTFGQTPGRFGVFGAQSLAGRSTTFDNFRAAFFEGAVHGDPSAAAPTTTPLLRRQADYRECADGHCKGADGCCLQDSDCLNNNGNNSSSNSCLTAQDERVGVGSHAAVCTASHCSNRVLDADEVRADCGGADCPPCASPTCSTNRGGSGYCTNTCICGIGDGDCATHESCMPGTICGQSRGYRYGWADGSEACTPYHCFDRVQDADELGVDWGGSCGSVQCSSAPNGGFMHCTPSCRCTLGHGDCTYADDCKSGLICGGKGLHFSITGNACVPAGCTNKVQDLALGETSADCGGACGCGGCPAGCQGLPAPQGTAITIPTDTPYTQNFDSIGTSATATLPAAWRIDSLANPRTQGTYTAAGTATSLAAGASMSTSATNGLYNFGSGSAAMGSSYWGSSTDRALGWLATGATVAAGGTKSGDLYLQLAAPANTDISSLTVSYKLEKYRKGTTTAGWKVQLYYSVNGTSWASAGSSFSTAFANDAQAGGYDPAPGTATTVNATLAQYVPRGTPLYLAWNYTTTSGTAVDATSAPALAIDDVSILGAVSQ